MSSSDDTPSSADRTDSDEPTSSSAASDSDADTVSSSPSSAAVSSSETDTSDSDTDSDSASQSDSESSTSGSSSSGSSSSSDSGSDADSSSSSADEAGSGSGAEITLGKKPLDRKRAQEFAKKLRRRGVCYLSSVPPFMKPQKMKHLLEQYGRINRIYLKPEDEEVRLRRKKAGGNKKIKYTEGWVEFEDKKVAKQVAATLNGNIVGGSRRSFFHDDIWTIKYMKGLTWDDLTAELAHQNAIKKQKLRQELERASRETRAILENVKQARIADQIRERRERKAAAAGASAATAAGPAPTAAPALLSSVASEAALRAIRRVFKQRAAVKEDAAPRLTEERARRLLGLSAASAAAPSGSDAAPAPKRSAAFAGSNETKKGRTQASS